MTTSFLRLLKAEDKEAALASSIATLRSDAPDAATVFTLDPAKFSKVPNSPFAYWVDDEIRELFTKFPPFESEGRTVKQGLATADDFRFVRAWWEVLMERRLDASNGPDWHEDIPAFQAWCRKRTHEGKYWAPFAKGGEYSPYYADIHLVVNWRDEGEEIKNNRNEAGGIRSNVWMLKDTERTYFFRPGVTWPRRTQIGLGVRAMPAGCVFADKGPAAFSNSGKAELIRMLTVMTSEVYRYLVSLQMVFGSYEVGIIQRTPYPKSSTDIFMKPTLIEWESKASNDTMDETTNVFSCTTSTEGSIPLPNGWDWYGVAKQKDNSPKQRDSEPDKNEDEDEDISVLNTDNVIFSVILGNVFGRFDIRIVGDPSLSTTLYDPFDPLPVCPPMLLVGTDGLPARADNIASEAWLRTRPNAISLPPEPVRSQKISTSDYPLDIPWDGILADDPEDGRDIIARLRAVLVYLHGDEAEAKERELCVELEVSDLRDYLRKPSLFFDSHLKRYSKSRRKAPIYWPLQTRDGRYTIWLYYPRLTADTLYGCSNILEAKLKLERRKLELARADLEKSESKLDRAKVEELSDFVSSLNEMKEEIERVASLPYKPDLDDGVQISAAPLWSLFRLPSWQKELKTTWEKLENGDYDWAHLAYAIWPDRVREKCRKDRSLAIAHGLEDICEQKAPEKKAGGKKRGRKTSSPAPEDESGFDFDE